jgi:predicted nucleic-acid-binding protein
VVLAEGVWVLETGYGLLRAEVAEVVEEMLAGSDFTLERESEVMEALQLFGASKADFADCLILAQARAAGELPLLTFDRALGKLQGAQRL